MRTVGGFAVSSGDCDAPRWPLRSWETGTEPSQSRQAGVIARLVSFDAKASRTEVPWTTTVQRPTRMS